MCFWRGMVSYFCIWHDVIIYMYKMVNTGKTKWLWVSILVIKEQMRKELQNSRAQKNRKDVANWLPKLTATGEVIANSVLLLSPYLLFKSKYCTNSWERCKAILLLMHFACKLQYSKFKHFNPEELFVTIQAMWIQFKDSVPLQKRGTKGTLFNLTESQVSSWLTLLMV